MAIRKRLSDNTMYITTEQLKAYRRLLGHPDDSVEGDARIKAYEEYRVRKLAEAEKKAEALRKKKLIKEKHASLMTPPIKHPRTRHLPWSPGRTSDDVSVPLAHMEAYFKDQEVVVTLKMDGECTTFYKDYIHARSINSYGRRPYRDAVKALHEQVRHVIPAHMRICGENMFAKHSIGYENMPSYFLVHSIWYHKLTALGSARNTCLSWDETELIAEEMGLSTVPVLYRGVYNEALIKSLYQAKCGGNDMEGYVVRRAGAFSYGDFAKYVAKFVREGHVTTDEHWMTQEIVKNTLKAKK